MGGMEDERVRREGERLPAKIFQVASHKQEREIRQLVDMWRHVQPRRDSASPTGENRPTRRSRRFTPKKWPQSRYVGAAAFFDIILLTSPSNLSIVSCMNRTFGTAGTSPRPATRHHRPRRPPRVSLSRCIAGAAFRMDFQRVARHVTDHLQRARDAPLCRSRQSRADSRPSARSLHVHRAHSALDTVFDDVTAMLWKWTEHASHPLHSRSFQSRADPMCVIAEALAALTSQPRDVGLRSGANEIERHMLSFSHAALRTRSRQPGLLTSRPAARNRTTRR